MTKIEELTFPFKLPVRIEDNKFLVAADNELIMKNYDTAPQSLGVLVKAINTLPDLIKVVEELRIAAYMLQDEYPHSDERWQRAQQMLDLLEELK